MSQTTLCPACQTRFKVVADQLRISDGWVRCGQCQLVFDAYESLEAQASQSMLPEMNLEQLRAPVARTQPVAAPNAAWQLAGGPGATIEARGRLETAPEAPTVPPFVDSLEPIPGFQEEDGQPEFENTVPAELWHDPEPPGRFSAHGFLSSESPSLAAFPSLGNSVPLDPRWDTLHAFSDGPAVRRNPEQVSVHPERDVVVGGNPAVLSGEVAEKARSESAKTEEEARALERKPVPMRGYELPGSVNEEDESGWALFPESPDEDLSTVPHRSGKSPALISPYSEDAPEPDLADFIAEFTDWQGQARAHHSASPLGLPSNGAMLKSPPPVPLAESEFESEVDAGRTPASGLTTNKNTHLEAEQNSRLPPHSPSDWQMLDTDNASFDALMPEGADATDLYPEEKALAREINAEHEGLAFVRRARSIAFWSGLRVRMTLWLSATVLVLLLIFQGALHNRDLLSVAFPAVRSALVASCDLLRCVIAPHRDIASVFVEGSSFNRIQGEKYQFSLTLRNSSNFDVEAPAIELTLTDLQDQTVIRRVLLAAELSMPDTLQPSQEWSATSTISVGPGIARIAGYRVLAFYPQ